jgi:D-alanine-D-alanine ligase
MRRIAILVSDDAMLASGAPEDTVAVVQVRAVADQVEQACRELGWQVSRVGVGRDPARLLADLERAGPDLAFHLAESVGGDARGEATVAGLLEWIGLPYTGSPPHALLHALDKPGARALLAARGLPVARGVLLERGDEALGALAPPFIVKPSREDASHGVDRGSVAADETAARARARQLIERYRQPALLEEFVDGREFDVVLLGPAHDPQPLPLIEIDFTGFPPGHPRLVTYAAKWYADSDEYRALEMIPARALPAGVAERIAESACAAWRALDLRGYGRVDFRLGDDGRLIVLEVNPNPDLMPDESVAIAAGLAGIGYASLIERLADQALGKPAARVREG